jgi:hypothetical protein
MSYTAGPALALFATPPTGPSFLFWGRHFERRLLAASRQAGFGERHAESGHLKIVGDILTRPKV